MNLKEKLDNKQKILNQLSSLQKELSQYYKKPSKDELALKLFNKKYQNLILDDIILINRMLIHWDKFSVFF